MKHNRGHARRNRRDKKDGSQVVGSASGKDKFSRSQYGSASHAAEPQHSESYRQDGDPLIASTVVPVIPPTSDNPYSRINENTSAHKRYRSRKRRRHVLIACLSVALVAILAGAGVAFGYVSRIQANLSNNVSKEAMAALDTSYAGDPFYMLLMGTDRSQERAESEEYAGDNFRSDSMILARIDPDAKQVTMVSLHRDTAIQMGSNGMQKLNAAHAMGGTAYAVKVVSEFAGVPISQFAEIDFDGFKAVVDALGGVEVDVPMEINDVDAGGHVDAGLQTLNGDQALILCRARHAYDEYGDGDRYRAANQRLVLGAIADKIASSNPMTIAKTVEALSQYVTTSMSVSDIVSLASSLVGMDAEKDIYSAMEPTESQLVNGAWYEFVDKDEWETMMSRVKQGLPPTEDDQIDVVSGTVLASVGGVDSSNNSTSDEDTGTLEPGMRTGNVTVKNGNGIDGVGDKAASVVQGLGYTANASNANNFNYERSVVVYRTADQRTAAREMADSLGIETVTQNENGAYVFDGDYLVLLGADFQ